MLRGFIPGGIGCWKEKTPARCRYIPDNITGAILEPKQLKNSRETLSLQHRRLYDARAVRHGLLARFSGSGHCWHSRQPDRELAE